MTKEQEAQQARIISEIREQNKFAQELGNTGPATVRCAKLLEIVDSQAQKIAEQAQRIATNAAYAIELQGNISEQAKEIERLRNLVRKTSGVEPDPYSVVVGGPGAPGYDGGAP